MAAAEFEQLTLRLEGGKPWGFRLQGGKDHRAPLQITKLQRDGKAAQQGVHENDYILAINDVACDNVLHSEALGLLKTSGNVVVMKLQRGGAPLRHGQSIDANKAAPPKWLARSSSFKRRKLRAARPDNQSDEEDNKDAPGDSKAIADAPDGVSHSKQSSEVIANEAAAAAESAVVPAQEAERAAVEIPAEPVPAAAVAVVIPEPSAPKDQGPVEINIEAQAPQSTAQEEDAQDPHPRQDSVELLSSPTKFSRPAAPGRGNRRLTHGSAGKSLDSGGASSTKDVESNIVPASGGKGTSDKAWYKQLFKSINTGDDDAELAEANQHSLTVPKSPRKVSRSPTFGGTASPRVTPTVAPKPKMKQRSLTTDDARTEDRRSAAPTAVSPPATHRARSSTIADPTSVKPPIAKKPALLPKPESPLKLVTQSPTKAHLPHSPSPTKVPSASSSPSPKTPISPTSPAKPPRSKPCISPKPSSAPKALVSRPLPIRQLSPAKQAAAPPAAAATAASAAAVAAIAATAAPDQAETSSPLQPAQDTAAVGVPTEDVSAGEETSTVMHDAPTEEPADVQETEQGLSIGIAAESITSEPEIAAAVTAEQVQEIPESEAHPAEEFWPDVPHSFADQADAMVDSNADTDGGAAASEDTLGMAQDEAGIAEAAADLPQVETVPIQEDSALAASGIAPEDSALAASGIAPEDSALAASGIAPEAEAQHTYVVEEPKEQEEVEEHNQTQDGGQELQVEEVDASADTLGQASIGGQDASAEEPAELIVEEAEQTEALPPATALDEDAGADDVQDSAEAGQEEATLEIPSATDADDDEGGDSIYDDVLPLESTAATEAAVVEVELPVVEVEVPVVAAEEEEEEDQQQQPMVAEAVASADIYEDVANTEPLQQVMAEAEEEEAGDEIYDDVVPLDNDIIDGGAKRAASLEHEVKELLSNHGLGKGLYQYKAHSSRELSFVRGDEITLLRKVDENWVEGELNGSKGILPVNYVEVLIPIPQAMPASKPPPAISPRRQPAAAKIASAAAAATPAVTSPSETSRPRAGSVAKPTRAPPSAPGAASAAASNSSSSSYASTATTSTADSRNNTKNTALVKPCAIARHEFAADHKWELSLKKGELVTLISRVDENWYEGRLSGKKGIFPVAYVEVLRDVEPSTNGQQQEQAPQQQQETDNGTNSMADHVPDSAAKAASGERYVALFAYVAQNSDELDLQEGDEVLVEEKCDDGWFVGRSVRSGAFGTFPGNYVKAT